MAISGTEQFNNQLNEIRQAQYVRGEASIVDEVSAALQYIGTGPLSGDTSLPIWQIKKVEKVGTVTRITYADGDNKFDNVWDNRAALSYA